MVIMMDLFMYMLMFWLYFKEAGIEIISGVGVRGVV